MEKYYRCQVKVMSSVATPPKSNCGEYSFKSPVLPEDEGMELDSVVARLENLAREKYGDAALLTGFNIVSDEEDDFAYEQTILEYRVKQLKECADEILAAYEDGNYFRSNAGKTWYDLKDATEEIRKILNKKYPLHIRNGFSVF